MKVTVARLLPLYGLGQNLIMPYGESWLPVWAALSDESLEQRLRHYYWLSMSAPTLYQSRFALLSAEAMRRGKEEIIENAKNWVARHGSGPLL